MEKTLHIQLTSIAGSFELYAKVCKPNMGECRLFQFEAFSNSSDVKVVKDSNPVKEIILPVICTNETNPANVPNGTLTSSTCMFQIMIVAPNKNEPLAKYQLKLEDSSEVHNLSPDHFTNIRLLVGAAKTYDFAYNHPRANSAGLEFSIFAVFGRFEVCIGRQSSPQSSKPECIYQDTVDASSGGLIQSYRTFFFGSENINPLRKNTPGVYRIYILAQELSQLTLGVKELSGFSSNFLARELPQGTPIIESPRNHTEPIYYTFGLTGVDLPAAAIQINLSPIVGEYIMVLTTSQTKPTLDQFIWKSDTHSIVVTSGDTSYDPKATYTLGVIPVVRSEVDFRHGDLQFQLKWTFTGQNSLLLPGIPEYGKLAHRKMCFISEIKPTWRDVYVFKHGTSKNLDLFANLGSKHSAPTKNRHMFKALANWAGFSLSQTEMKNACNGEPQGKCLLYMCIYGKKHEEYMLLVNYEDKPIALKMGKTLHTALPTKGQNLQFISYPKKGEPLDLEAYSADSHVIMSVALAEDKLVHNFPTATAFELQAADGLKPAEVKHFTREEVMKFTRPVALITLTGLAESPHNERFHLKSEIGIEATDSLRELVKGAPRTCHTEANAYTYFFFYNHEPSIPVMIKLDSLNGADCDIYVSRGPNSRPTVTNYLAKSNNYRSAFVNLNSFLIRGKGFPNLVGYYVVGVRAVQNLKFMISWTHSNTLIAQGYFNQNIQGTLPPGSRVVYKNTNFYDSNIVVQLKNNYADVNFYYRTAGKDRSFKENDLSLFPSKSNSLPDHTFSSKQRISYVEITKDNPNWCKQCDFFFTFENSNLQQPIEISIMVRPSSPGVMSFPEVVTFGKSYENIGLKNTEMSMSLELNPTQMTTIADSFIEIHTIYGSAVMSYSTRRTGPFGSPQGLLLLAEVKKGYTSVDFPPDTAEKLKADGSTTIYFKLKFAEETTYRFVLNSPNQLKELTVNEPVRGYLRGRSTKPDVFVYQTNGNESRFDVSFTIDHFLIPNSSIVNKDLSASRNLLEQAVQVFFVKDKTLLNMYHSFKRLPAFQHLDLTNRNMDYEFRPLKGLYVIQVASPSGDPLKYRLEMTTNRIRNVASDNFVINHVAPGEEEHKYFQFTSEYSGNAFIKLFRCAGNIDLKANTEPANFGSSLSLEDGKYVDFWAPNHPQQRVYLKAEARPEVVRRKTGYLNKANQTGVFSFQIVQRTRVGAVKNPFSSIVPYDDEISLDLTGSRPIVNFRPLNLTEDWISHGQHQYFVVVSRDPELVKYYVGCGDYYLNKLLKPGVKQKNVLWVFNTQKSPQPFFEKSTAKPYLSVVMDIPSGHRYFLTIYAIASDDQQALVGDPSREDQPKLGQIKIIYSDLDFEFKSYFYPLELMAASIGMVGVCLLAVCMVWFSCISRKRLSNEYQNTNPGADPELEDYYLQIKKDFSAREDSRKKLLQSQQDGNDSSTTLDGNTTAQVLLNDTTLPTDEGRTAELTNL